MLHRRQFLLSAGTVGVGLAMTPCLVLATDRTERRFVLVIQRGAMDGLAAVPPWGDRDYNSARGALALGAPGTSGGVIDLDGHFGLHPSLAPLVPFWHKGELLVLHAIASPYRDRSHFDGQDMLETGAIRPHALADGWLGRTLAELGPGSDKLGLAAGQGVPQVLRGPVTVSSWAPQLLPGLSPDTLRSLASIYQHDGLFRHALDEGAQAVDFADATLGADVMAGNEGASKAAHLNPRKQFVMLAHDIGRLLAAANGPRIAVIESLGWDTHADQGTTAGRLAPVLGTLAEGLAALADAMGPVWRQTAVMTVSEFGRTAGPNGTGGTDHGTATASLLLGGAVAGGRVATDWPGLAKSALFDGRDLAPTLDLRAAFKGILGEHLSVARGSLDRAIFPDSASLQPMKGLIRA